MRAMGLDIGSVTVGVSLSDGLKMIASSYTVIRYEEENDELLQEELEELEECEEIIVKLNDKELEGKDKLKIMDMTAISLCMDNNIPIRIFNINDLTNLEKALTGKYPEEKKKSMKN